MQEFRFQLIIWFPTHDMVNLTVAKSAQHGLNFPIRVGCLLIVAQLAVDWRSLPVTLHTGFTLAMLTVPNHVQLQALDLELSICP